MKTGDVCEQLGPDEFAWIDRVSNIIKMSQGEYVSVSRLEAIYTANSPSIHQMYLYGNSLRAHLVAIVVPNQGAEPCLHADAFKLCLQQTRPMPCSRRSHVCMPYWAGKVWHWPLSKKGLMAEERTLLVGSGGICTDV